LNNIGYHYDYIIINITHQYHIWTFSFCEYKN